MRRGEGLVSEGCLGFVIEGLVDGDLRSGVRLSGRCGDAVTGWEVSEKECWGGEKEDGRRVGRRRLFLSRNGRSDRDGSAR